MKISRSQLRRLIDEVANTVPHEVDSTDSKGKSHRTLYVKGHDQTELDDDEGHEPNKATPSAYADIHIDRQGAMGANHVHNVTELVKRVVRHYLTH
jgi:hypothetical protein